ncbi:MAG TPA: hypothetical protein VMR41_00990 [Patescibacteria group bacterium]|nr:hypothetical protein [Patescibacteria group bacterium]
MNDTAQNSNVTQASQPIVPPVVPPQQPPAQPVSLPNKEQGPMGQVSEYMKPSDVAETKPEIPAEVKEAGVEHAENVEHLQLNEEHAQVGIQHAKESVPVAPTIARPAALTIPNAPFTKEEAVKVFKTTGTDDTQHWLSALFLAVLKKFQLQQKQHAVALPVDSPQENGKVLKI